MVAETPFGWHHFNPGTQSWTRGFTVSHGGPCSELPPYEVLSSTLPTGDYTFYFGIDMIMNGQLDMGEAYYNTVEVTVSP